MPIAPEEYFDLSMEELREVTRFAVLSAEDVLGLFEAAKPDDPRPRAAVDAAWAFANGGARGKALRVTAADAHRAAKAATTEAASHAAYAAGDAAASAYLHPYARADQVGHILRASAHAARARELAAEVPDSAARHIEEAAERATPTLVDVLRRYPAAPTGRTRVAELMTLLDRRLR